MVTDRAQGVASLADGQLEVLLHLTPILTLSLSLSLTLTLFMSLTLNPNPTQVLLHRRLLRDDGRGVGEPLDEQECDSDHADCAGLTVIGRHLISLSRPDTAVRTRLAWVRVREG